MNVKTWLYLAVLMLAFFLSMATAFWAGRTVGRREAPAGKPDTVYRTKWIAAPIPEPTEKPVLPKLVFLPVHDTTAVHDTTHTTDSVLVEVPITEKHYIDEDYRATVRGFQPELVDIWIRQKEMTIRVPYRKHWSFTVGPQIGYGLTPKGAQPYAGAGITFGYSF